MLKLLYNDKFNGDFWKFDSNHHWDAPRPPQYTNPSGGLSQSITSEDGAMVIRWNYNDNKTRVLRYALQLGTSVVARSDPQYILDYSLVSSGCTVSWRLSSTGGTILNNTSREQITKSLEQLTGTDILRDSGPCQAFNILISPNGPCNGELRLYDYSVYGDIKNTYYSTVHQYAITAPDMPIISPGDTINLVGVKGQHLHFAIVNIPLGVLPQIEGFQAELKWSSQWKRWLLNNPALGGTDALKDNDVLQPRSTSSNRLVVSLSADKIENGIIRCGDKIVTVNVNILPFELDEPICSIGGYVNQDIPTEAMSYLTSIDALQRTEMFIVQDSDRATTTNLANNTIASWPLQKDYVLDSLITYPYWRYMYGPIEDKYRLDEGYWVGDVIRSRLDACKVPKNQNKWLYTWDEAQDGKLHIQAPIFELGLNKGYRWYAAIRKYYYYSTVRPDLYYPTAEAWSHWTAKYGKTFGELIDWWICTERNYAFGLMLKRDKKRYSTYGYPFADDTTVNGDISMGPGAYARFRREVWRAYLSNADSYMLYSWNDIQGSPLGAGRKMGAWIKFNDNSVRFQELALGLQAGYWDMRYLATLQRLVLEAEKHNPRPYVVIEARRFVDGCNSTPTFQQDCAKYIKYLLEIKDNI